MSPVPEAGATGGRAGSPRGSPPRPFDRLAYRDPHPDSALIRALEPLNRYFILGTLLRLQSIDLPEPDLQRLRAAVRPGTAAFVGPNHPEFMTDWMLDKEISRRVSPLMAHWASYEIVNLNPWVQDFWLRNNLIANVPGGGGKEYSVRWALAGHGVLLHPEGTASWQGDRIGPLVPGIVDLAWEAARRAREAGSSKPVYVVPVVWKLHFVHDVSRGLHREMAVIERRLSLPPGRGLALGDRLLALQRALLVRQSERFGIPAPHLYEGAAGAAYFAAQEAAVEALLHRLSARYGSFEGPPGRVIHALRRAIHEAHSDPGEAARQRAMVFEVERLSNFAPDLYGGDYLTQERIAEVLKRTRTTLLTRGLRNQLHALMPIAVGRRIAQVRVPEPIAVHEALAAAAEEAEARAERARLLALLHERMQETLAALNAQVAPVVSRFRHPNPFRIAA